MVDVVDPATRSRMMAGIRGKDTRPELLIRRALHRAGFRFRVHDRRLPGAPDLILPKYRSAIFVHGCFWHRHDGCRYTTMPATRAQFWEQKFSRNIARDRENRAALNALGWRVLVVWECGVRHDPSDTIELVASWLADGSEGACDHLPARPPRPAER